jgi:hypothetical protein
MTPRFYLMCMMLFFWPLSAFSKDNEAGAQQSPEPTVLPTIIRDAAENAGSAGITGDDRNEPAENVITGATSDENRVAARKAYDAGRKLIHNGDFVRACGAFEHALSFVRLPIILFAAAQCRKDLGHDVEALYLFSAALKANERSARSHPVSDYLTPIQAEAAFRNMEDLLKRFVQVEFVVPQGDALVGVRVNGDVWGNVQIFGARRPLEDSADEAEAVLSHGPGDPININLGVAKKRLDEMLAVHPTPQKFLAAWWMKPGSYTFELVLKSGRRMFLRHQEVAGPHNIIDLQKKMWPAYVVVEEVPPNTRLMLKGANPQTVLVDLPEQKERKRDFEISILHPGNYELIVTRKGYRKIGRRLKMDAGQRQSVYLDFKEKPLLRKWQFWVGVGVAAVAFAGGAIPVAYAASH